MKTRSVIASGMVAMCCAATAVHAAQFSNDTVKIGVLTDFQSHFADVGGKNSVLAAQMAIDDFGKTIEGKPIELISADHDNKPDNASAIARRWYDEEGVDLILDVPTSAAALAVQKIAHAKDKMVIFTSPSTEALTNKECSPTGINWSYDGYAIAKTLARTLATAGSRWFFLTINTGGGIALQNSATPFIEAAGGKVVGSVRHPQNAGDMASFLLQAQTSGAQYVALANAGTDLVNAVRQAGEFGITPAQSLVAVAMFMSDLRSLGLAAGKGMQFVTSFDAAASPEAAQWSARFVNLTGHLPNDVHAAVYSATLSWLKAVAATGTDDATTVMGYLRKTPVNDMYARNGKVRIDGRMVHDMYVVRAKTPQQSSGPNDLVELLEVIPGDEAFRPLAESTCPLVRK